MQAASNPAFRQYQASREPLFRHSHEGRPIRSRAAGSSDLVVVVADADHVGDVVVFFLFVGEERVILVVAEIDVFLVVARSGRSSAPLTSSSASSSETTSAPFFLGVDFLLARLPLPPRWRLSCLPRNRSADRSCRYRARRSGPCSDRRIFGRLRVDTFCAKFGFCHGKPRP